MKKQALFLCLGLLMSICSFAQPEFTVTVSYDTVGLTEAFEVKYTIKNTDIVGTFTPPPFDGFNLVGGPMQGQNISIINGNMSKSYTYTYILQAQNMGSYVIMGTSIETEEGTLMTDDIPVVVVEHVNRPAPPQAFGNSPFGNDPFFNGGGFGFEQHQEMQERMQEMQRQMDQRMKEFWGETPSPQEPPVNEAPSEDSPSGKKPSEEKKKKKPKGKVYKI